MGYFDGISEVRFGFPVHVWVLVGEKRGAVGMMRRDWRVVKIGLASGDELVDMCYILVDLSYPDLLRES